VLWQFVFEFCFHPSSLLRGQSEVEFFHEWPEAFAESLIDRAEDIVGLEVFALDAAAGANVIAHLFQPGELIGGETDSSAALLFESSGESLPNVFFERFERSCGFDRGANKRQ